MRKSLCLILFILSPFICARRGGPDTVAEYIVPTEPQYIAFSRFNVEIVDRFEGPETTEISYIFPEFLVGEPDRVIRFTRIPGTVNSWRSPELEAHCAVLGEEFTCNIYGNNSLVANKATSSCGTTLLKNVATPDFSRERSLTHLDDMNLTEEEKLGFSGVINSFFCQEPRGFLTYDID